LGAFIIKNIMTLLDLLNKIISIDSVSGQEEELSNFVYNFLKDLGLSPIKDSSNMVFCRCGDGEPILLCAHMDTVEPGKGIKAVTENGYLKSDGKTILGGDNKVALATILYNVQELVSQNQLPNVELLFTVREETDSGIKKFDTSMIKSKFGFIFDGGNGSLEWIVESAPTISDFVVEIEGKSAHASRPEQGVNVIEALLKIKELGVELGRLDENTTFNIGKIMAGKASNSIPDNLFMEGDLRSNSKQTFAVYKQYINTMLHKAARACNCKAKINWIMYSVGFEMKQDQSLENLKSIYKKLGLELKPVKTTSGSDANFLNSKKITTFCLGDGVEDIHTTNEKIELKKLDKLKDLIQELMLNYTVNFK
jgi:tripeptide aminopeptidase